MTEPRPHTNNPMHGITLEMVLTYLVKRYGWPAMFKEVELRCFLNDPSIKSSLIFLRRTPWARVEVENMYLRAFKLPQQPATLHFAKSLDVRAWMIRSIP